MTTRTNRRLGTVAAIGLIALATLVAGCAGPGAAGEGDNQAPEAKLTSTKNVGWTGDSFSFDARESSDPDGNITEWRFDFGDGSKQVANRDEDARVNHIYARGGEYTVTVTVMDDGKDDTGALSDTTTKTVAINEKVPIAQQVIYAAPANQSGALQSKYQQQFQTTEDADRFELRVDLRSTLAAGSSVVRIRVLDADGDILDEEKVTLAAGGMHTAELEGNLYDDGAHKVEMLAESGGATATGELRVFYDRGYSQ